MRIRDICRNLEEPIIFKAKPCPLEMPSCFGVLNDKNIDNAFKNGYLVVETLYPYVSAGCSENGECPYVNAAGRLVIIDPEMTGCKEYRGEATPSLTEGRPCSPSARP